MDTDYKNFGERMGSFDMEFELGDSKVQEILHHGVKGMKWGVTKAQTTSAQRKAAKRTYNAEERKGVKALGNLKRSVEDNNYQAKRVQTSGKINKAAQKVQSKVNNKATRAIANKTQSNLANREEKHKAAFKQVQKNQRAVNTSVEKASKMPISIAYRPRRTMAKNIARDLALAYLNGRPTSVPLQNSREDTYREMVRAKQKGK